MVYANVTQVWTGDLTQPDDMDTITLSKKELIEFGGADKEKVNFTVEYDVTDLYYAANISIGLLFDKKIVVYQTDLKGVQGTALASFRLPFLPKYENQMRKGKHILDIIIKVRPRYSIWHMIDNYKDFTELKSVSESSTSRYIVLTE